MQENREYILPIKLESVEIPGIPNTTGYIDFYKEGTEKIVKLFLEKLKRLNSY